MSLSFRLLPEALAEFGEAAEWYSDQQPGVGDDLVGRVEWVFDRVAANPKMHAGFTMTCGMRS